MMQFSEQSLAWQARLTAFMDEHIYPNEHRYAEELAGADDRFAALPLMDELKAKAREAGLWNMFIPPAHASYADHDGLSNFDYAPLAEILFFRFITKQNLLTRPDRDALAIIAANLCSFLIGKAFLGRLILDAVRSLTR